MSEAATPLKRADVAGVILAGGLSRRMAGKTKPLLPLGGVPLLAHVRNRLAPQVCRMLISANDDAERYAQFCLPVQADPVGDRRSGKNSAPAGPLAGVLAGMMWARQAAPDASHLISVAADTPFFPPDLVARLAEGLAQGGVAMAASMDRRHPVFALWPVALAEDLEQFLASGEKASVERFAARHGGVSVDFPEVETGEKAFDPFFNINTPQDLEAAQAILALLHGDS